MKKKNNKKRKAKKGNFFDLEALDNVFVRTLLELVDKKHEHTN